MTVTTKSKADILSEKSALDDIKSSSNAAFRKSGTWAERLNRQTSWQRAHANDNYAERKKLNDSILSNPVNISRWKSESEAEERKIIEEKRLEDSRITEEKRIEAKRLQDIEDLRLNTEFRIEQMRLKEIENQMITFNEQTNSGDFNETPITDVNLDGGCSECTEPEHQMPDGSMMKDSDMEKEKIMRMAGIAAIGIIGLMAFKK